MKGLQIDKLLVIAGGGNYPKILLEEARASGIGYIEVVAFKGETDKASVISADIVHWMRVGELENMLNRIKLSNISKLMLVGQIAPKNIFSVRMDHSTKSLLNELPIVNAHTVFTSLIFKIEEMGVEVLPAHTFIMNYLPKPGVLSSRAPSDQEDKDMQLGVQFIKSNSQFDIGQVVAVKSGYIIAVEAMEGTNATIKRAGKLGGPGAVIVKVPKVDHDFRFDIPVIGPKTIEIMKKTKATCLAIQSGAAIIFDRDKTISMANEANISIIAMEHIDE